MSEVVTVSAGVTGTIYGTFDGATSYLGASGSEAAVAFRGLTDDAERKRALIDATRYLNQLAYVTDYTTFAERDALDLGTGGDDAAFPFRAACYVLAGLAAADPDVLVVDDQGSNIARVYAGGAGVDYFAQTSARRGTAPPLPSPVMALIAPYLALADITLEGGTGDTGSCVNPFGPCRDLDRRGPF